MNKRILTALYGIDNTLCLMGAMYAFEHSLNVYGVFFVLNMIVLIVVANLKK